MFQITCENADGVRRSFLAGKGFDGFLLADATGVLEGRAQLLASEAGMMDGSVYHGARMQPRNIVLTLRDAPGSDHAQNREALFTLFKFKSRGTLTFRDKVSRQIGYYVESVSATPSRRSNSYQVSLLCPNPYWEDVAVQSYSIGGINAGFTFQHLFHAQGEAFGYRGRDRAFTVENESASDDIGLTIEIAASGGYVINPRIYHLQTGEVLGLGDSATRFVLTDGQTVTITTGRGQKQILGQNGQSLAGYLTEESEFITLRRGTNTIRCAAQGGDANLAATFSWRLIYEGV